MDESKTTIEVEGLKQLIKAFSKPPVGRVGILGNKDARSAGKASSNATIGATHEYGSPSKNIAMRSFLRVPIAKHLGSEMEKEGLLKLSVFIKVIRTGSLVGWLKKVATLGERIARDSFASRGDGAWPKWKNPNYTNNANMLLVDTTQLRDSITSDVKS